jgi:exosome complex component RRP42
MSSKKGTKTTVSSAEERYILEGCNGNCRIDGRLRNEFRPYYSIVGDFDLSHGSARVFLATGETHVLVSVKAELVVPATERPRDGVVEIHVDFMHGSNHRDEDIESTLSSLLVPHLVDSRELCICEDYYVWKLNIDLLVITSGGGSLLDACSQGIQAALQKTLLPRITVVPASEGGGDKPTIQVDSDIKAAQNVPGISSVPVVVTVSLLRHKTKPIMIVDATGEEEACSFAQVHVVVDRCTSNNKREPMICALHKAGGGALPFGLLQDVTSFVLEVSTSAQLVVSESLHHLLQDSFSIQQ